jgi:hypothetical protein
MSIGVTVSARTPFGGPPSVIARYDTTPGRIWSVSIPSLPHDGQATVTNGPAVTVTLSEASSGLPEDELAVVNGLGEIMAEPGAKRIRLNVLRSDGSPSGLLGDGRLALHVHLLETTSQLRYGGDVTTYTVDVSADTRPTAPSPGRAINVRPRQAVGDSQ